MAGDRRPERTGIIPGMLGDSPHRPRAASLQRSLNTADHVLTNLARQQHPTVAWWWGVRKVDGIMCAWCYVCDGSIVEGALNVGITEAQTDAIETHKQSHWQQAMAALADPEGF